MVLDDCEITGDLTVAGGTVEVPSLTHSPRIAVLGTLSTDSIVADAIVIGELGVSQASSFSGDVNDSLAPVAPEPSALCLLAAALAAFAARAACRRRRP